jgi:maltooligosyltrehalose trehalohydrolase
MSEDWAPGATPDRDGTMFAVWTTRARQVRVRLFDASREVAREVDLDARGEGCFAARLAGVGPGALYKFVLDDDEVPDPYARFLPHGVHGPAEVVARGRAPSLPSRVALDAAVTYELHVGTFTREGTFAAAAERLADLAALGISVVELMPVAAFDGARGWGYDGVAHYAPHASYGRPEDLRRFVERAHALGLGVFLDVVHNHFGPSGNYLARYASEYFTDAHTTPWGVAPDFTHPRMRQHVLGSAHMWFEEYGVDGLRLDATQAIVDHSPRHILRDLASVASSCSPPRVLVAEDERNDPDLVLVHRADAIWVDDFHHTIRALLAGDRDGYYEAFEPTVAALAHVIERGWSYEGQFYSPWRRARGKPAGPMRYEQLVYYLENHDQAGNRAFGERLSHDVTLDAFAAATALLLFLPASPLLFMGQEWGATTPFLYFTDHEPELGTQVTKGRREEFKTFRAFSDVDVRERIPDPQALETFERSKLRWEERDRAEHAAILAVVRRMLELRRSDGVLRERCERGDLLARTEGDALVVERRGRAGRRVLLANFSKRGIPIDVRRFGEPVYATLPWQSAPSRDAVGVLPPESAVIVGDL